MPVVRRVGGQPFGLAPAQPTSIDILIAAYIGVVRNPLAVPRHIGDRKPLVVVGQPHRIGHGGFTTIGHSYRPQIADELEFGVR
jgi:hypothetical protein